MVSNCRADDVGVYEKFFHNGGKIQVLLFVVDGTCHESVKATSFMKLR